MVLLLIGVICIFITTVNGTTKECDNGTYSLTGYEPNCSNVTAQISSLPTLSVMASVGEDSFEFHCDIDYDKSDIQMEIFVNWFMDEKKVADVTLVKGNRKAILKESQWLQIKRQRVVTPLGFKVKCTMSGYYGKGRATPILQSNEYFAGIKILTPRPIMLKENEEGQISIQLTVPFLPFDNTVKLQLEARSVDKNNIANCPVGQEHPATVFAGFCSIKIGKTPVNNNIPTLQGEIYNLRVKATVDGIFNEKGGRQAILKLATAREVFEHEVWGGYILPDIEIITQDMDTGAINGKSCSSINDPHIKTFDGHIYENQLEGEFVFYKHTFLPFKVHTFYKRCGGYATCNCAVAVHSATDVIVIDVCDKGKFISRQGAAKIIKPFRLKMDGCDSESLARVVSSNNGRTYQVYLPTGGSLVVSVSGSFLNVQMYPSVLDVNSTEGLCGNFNGNCKDDLIVKSTGRLAAGVLDDECVGNSHIIGRHHNDFSSEWRVKTHDSLYKGTFDRSKNLLPFLGHKYCVCNDNNAITCEALKYVQPCRSTNHGKDITNRHVSRCRARRSTSFHDDVEDDFDNFTFEYNETFVPPVYNWPTPSGWTLQKATDFCEDYIRNASIARLCKKVQNVQYEDKVKGCIEDIKISDSTSWALAALEAMKGQCLSQVEKTELYWIPPSNVTDNVTGNVTSTSQPSGIADLSISTLIMSDMCPNECSFNGACTNGTCDCNDGFTSEDCSISSKVPPMVYYLPQGGLCDVRTRPCKTTRILGDQFVDSENLTCHFKEIEIILETNTSMISNGTTSTTKADFESFGELFCSLPITRKKRSVRPCRPVHAEAYRIAVSNDGNLTSSDLVLIRFDSACAECNSSGSCRKKKKVPTATLR